MELDEEGTARRKGADFARVFLPNRGCGVLRSWLIKEGEDVSMGQRLALVITHIDGLDVDVMVVSPQKGILRKCEVKEGEVVEERYPIALLEIDHSHTGSSEEYSLEGVEGDPVVMTGSSLFPGSGDPMRSPRSESKRGRYDTSQILANIRQLLRKRRDIERTIESMEQSGHPQSSTEWFRSVLDEIDNRVCDQRKKLLAIYKELKTRDLRKYYSGFLPFSLSRSQLDALTREIPRWLLSADVQTKPNASDQVVLSEPINGFVVPPDDNKRGEKPKAFKFRRSGERERSGQNHANRDHSPGELDTENSDELKKDDALETEKDVLPDGIETEKESKEKDGDSNATELRDQQQINDELSGEAKQADTESADDAKDTEPDKKRNSKKEVKAQATDDDNQAAEDADLDRCDNPPIEPVMNFSTVFSAVSTSTYPYIPSKKSRDGDPICDHYRVQLTPTNHVVAIADGCNWGRAPAEAARLAAKGFIDHLNKKRNHISDTVKAAQICLQGLAAAHNAIIAGEDEDRRIGTTTLLGGFVCRVLGQSDAVPTMCGHTTSEEGEPEAGGWAFVFASIGDCKAYLIRPHVQKIVELNQDARASTDAADCGGRLGPYVDGGPDLRNLGAWCVSCSEDDILLLCSDGVHDNLDPQHFAISPSSLGLDVEDWEDAEPLEMNKVKSAWRAQRMRELIWADDVDQDVTCNDITDRVLKHCFATTLSSQHFLQQNKGKKLPSDYTQYPGKMDHTTIVCLQVSPVPLCDINGAVSTSLGASAAPPSFVSKLQHTSHALMQSPSISNPRGLSEMVNGTEHAILDSDSASRPQARFNSGSAIRDDSNGSAEARQIRRLSKKVAACVKLFIESSAVSGTVDQVSSSSRKARRCVTATAELVKEATSIGIGDYAIAVQLGVARIIAFTKVIIMGAESDNMKLPTVRSAYNHLQISFIRSLKKLLRTFKTDSNGSITLSLPPPMSTPEREAREAEEEKIVPEISAEEDELSSGRRRQRSVDEESAESFSNDEEDADQTKKTGEDSATENGGIKDYESALFSPKAEDITGRDEEIQSLAAALHESLISGGGDLGPRREGNSGQKDMPVDLLIKEEATPKEAVKKEGNLGVADAGDLAGVSSLSPRTVKKMRLARRSLGPSSSRTDEETLRRLCIPEFANVKVGHIRSNFEALQ